MSYLVFILAIAGGGFAGFYIAWVIKNKELSLKNQELTLEKRILEERDVNIKQLEDRFKVLANDILERNASKFNDQSTENLNKLLTPLKNSLGEFKTSLDTTRKETETHSALLKDQIGRIGTEAANLTKALRGDVKTLGNWGENMLDQILEKSGLQRELHYRRQRGEKDIDGDQRFLDVIIDLPDKRNLVIDSKVSLRAYEEYVNATDDLAKSTALDRHIEALRKHFRELGAKRYQDIYGINTPDFVLMYIPIEPAFFVTVDRDPKLFAAALDCNVVLITNSTLLATLRTVENVWRLADQKKNVIEIADRGGKLYDKFVGFIQDMQNVGDFLKKAQETWESASTKLYTGTGNLVSQTEKIKQLGAKATKSLPAPLIEKANEENGKQKIIQTKELDSSL